MKNMPINMRNTERWSADVQKSVLFYNDWFLRFAPKTYVATRKSAMAKVEAAFAKTDFLRNITPELLEESPESVAILRMATIPPLARDRLAGLAYVPKQLVASTAAISDMRLWRESTGSGNIE